MAFETPGEIIGILEAAAQGDMADRILSLLQLPGCLLQSMDPQVVHRRKPGGFLEFSAKMGGGIAVSGGKLLRGDLPGKIQPNILQRIPDRSISPGGI